MKIIDIVKRALTEVNTAMLKYELIDHSIDVAKIIQPYVIIYMEIHVCVKVQLHVKNNKQIN